MSCTIEFVKFKKMGTYVIKIKSRELGKKSANKNRRKSGKSLWRKSANVSQFTLISFPTRKSAHLLWEGIVPNVVVDTEF